MDLVQRAGDLKPMLRDFALSPQFDREWSAVLERHFPGRVVTDESVFSMVLDHFALQHRLPSGTTVVEEFVAAHPELASGTPGHCPAKICRTLTRPQPTSAEDELLDQVRERQRLVALDRVPGLRHHLGEQPRQLRNCATSSSATNLDSSPRTTMTGAVIADCPATTE